MLAAQVLQLNQNHFPANSNMHADLLTKLHHFSVVQLSILI